MELETCLVAPPEWSRIPIAGVCSKFTSGGTPSRKKPEYFENGVLPWVKTKELSDAVLENVEEWITESAVAASSAKRLPRNTVLMAMYGATVGQLGVLGREMACNQACAAMVVDDIRCDYRFLYYQLLANRRQIVSMATGAAQQNLSGAQIKNWRIPLPSRKEQARIVELLWSLDDRIDLLRKTNTILEAIAQALFKSWFVDFDPVHAKAEGREAEAMDAATAALFPSEFEASELGPIPKGWRVRSIYDIASVRYGAPYASSIFNTEGNGLPLVRIRDLRTEQPGVWTPEVHPKGYLIRPGDIIVGMDGEFRAHLWGGEPAWMNQRVCAFHPIAPHCNVFVRNAIAAPLAQVEATETATTVIHLGKGDIDQFKVVVPSDELAAAFAACCQPLYDRIVFGKQQARNLADLRDTLLPRLISGKLRLPEAMEAAEAALA